MKTEAIRKTRVAVYCRVSTDMEEQEGSFTLQKEYYQRLIEENPQMVLAGIYGDQGKSGRSIAGRSAFQRMLRDCEDGKIDLILTKSISRFTRNMADCVSTVRRLKELHVEIRFEKEHFSTEDQLSELFLCILAILAEEESNSLSLSQKWSRREQNREGHPVVAPSYGYRDTNRDHIWRINDSEAKRVRLAFWMACCGRDYQEIRETLQVMEEQEGTGKVWNQTPLRYMLSNINYTGDFLTNKYCWIETADGRRYVVNDGYEDQFYIENHHEPLVSHAAYNAVQELLRRHLLFRSKSNLTWEDRRLLAAAQEAAECDPLLKGAELPWG